MIVVIDLSCLDVTTNNILVWALQAARLRGQRIMSSVILLALQIMAGLNCFMLLIRFNTIVISVSIAE